MSNALQQLWVSRREIGLIVVVLVTAALLLTFVITAHAAQEIAKVALALPAGVFALLKPTNLFFDWLEPERLACPLESFLPTVHGRSPPS